MRASSPALVVDSASAERSADLTVTMIVPGGMPLNRTIPPEEVNDLIVGLIVQPGVEGLF